MNPDNRLLFSFFICILFAFTFEVLQSHQVTKQKKIWNERVEFGFSSRQENSDKWNTKKNYVSQQPYFSGLRTLKSRPGANIKFGTSKIDDLLIVSDIVNLSESIWLFIILGAIWNDLFFKVLLSRSTARNS